MKNKDFQTHIKTWFLEEKRELPWRNDPTPYQVWVSEVMLQQTQVSVVIPYFERWMKEFPTLEHLAKSPLEKVIKLWEGLGYYSRARNLHEGAKYVCKEFRGILPNSKEKLKQIKGLGPYTIGAIRSFAFHEKVAAVDGNVIRVLCRYFGIEDDISKLNTVKKIWQIAGDNLPDEEPWIFNEGLIELGAMVCTRKPQCQECPLRRSCLGYRHRKQDKLPFKSTKTKITPLYRAVVLLENRGKYLIKKEVGRKIMSDLYEFPYFETDEKGMTLPKLTTNIQEKFGFEPQFKKEISSVKHTFTRYRVTLFPYQFTTHTNQKVEPYEWVSVKEMEKLPFSSGHRRVLINLF